MSDESDSISVEMALKAISAMSETNPTASVGDYLSAVSVLIVETARWLSKSCNEDVDHLMDVMNIGAYRYKVETDKTV